MKRTPTERAAIDGVLAAVHLDGRPSREIAEAFIVGIGEVDLPRSFVTTYRNHLMLIGAQKVCSDWRRRFTRSARTVKGTDVPAPLFAGARDDDGRHVQLRLDGMSLGDLEAKRRTLSKQRNSLSREVQLLTDLIDLMRERNLSTAGEALAALAVAS